MRPNVPSAPRRRRQEFVDSTWMPLGSLFFTFLNCESRNEQRWGLTRRFERFTDSQKLTNYDFGRWHATPNHHQVITILIRNLIR